MRTSVSIATQSPSVCPINSNVSMCLTLLGAEMQAVVLMYSVHIKCMLPAPIAASTLPQ